MGQTSKIAQGFFKRETKGMKTDPIAFDVEAGRISFFCEMIGEMNPIHHDADAARAAGFPGIVAPPTFAMVVDTETGRAAERAGKPSILTLIGCNLARLLHGEERYDYHGLIFAGDRLTVTTEIVDFEDKKGGALELAHLRAEIHHEQRGLVTVITRSLVHRLI
ncbi:MAG: MaoC family dehydratase N-terminal domain-containing protein [Ectothiorhodospiraceae bacterium]|nr:MaoC family dehydratase N-terminal domain-containing protein [Ectothiorhodospiraceae bacterium]